MAAFDLNHFLHVWIGGWHAPPLMHSGLENKKGRGQQEGKRWAEIAEVPRCQGKALSQSHWQLHITLKQSHHACDLCGLEYQTPDSLTKPVVG